MPSIIQREGLTAALIDFGVDASVRNPLLGDVALPIVALQDVSRNYEPALRARGFCHVDVAAGGAGTLAVASFQARPEGLWINGIYNHRVSGRQLLVRIEAARLIPAGLGFPMQWHLLGSAPGEARQVVGFGGVADFFGAAFQPAYSTPAIAVPQPAFGLQNSLNFPTASFTTPIWVPGNLWVNLFSDLQNDPLAFSIDVTFPALNPGRLP